MTCIMIGHKYRKHRLGTVYGALYDTFTLDSVATGINAYGTFTTSLPASPSTNQIITINNTCTGTITVSGNGNNIGAVSSVTLAAGVSGKFYWDGYTWGVWFSDCSASVLNATHDFGTTTQGPAETAYSVPADTVEYSSWWVNACGETVRKVVTTTYAGRSEGYTTWQGTVVGYLGATSQNKTTAAQNASLAYPYHSCATKFAPTQAWAEFEKLADASGSGAGDLIWSHQWADVPPYNCSGSPADFGIVRLSTNDRVYSVGSGTNYYLDTHIIWTYETL